MSLGGYRCRFTVFKGGGEGGGGVSGEWGYVLARWGE